jgi:hypothetical protein
MRGNHRNASTACQARIARHEGRASTASGTSHSEYCGDQTLFTSRKPATSRNSSCGSRGRVRATMARPPTPQTTATVASATQRLRTVGD